MKHHIEVVDWKNLQGFVATPAQVREIVMTGQGIRGLNPEPVPKEFQAYAALPNEIGNCNAMAIDAILAGRLIDFGYFTNDAIKQAGNRGTSLWEQGAYPMPFDDPWLFMHSWDSDEAQAAQYPRGDASTVYLIVPIDPQASNPCDIEIAEFQPIIETGIGRTLAVADRGRLKPPTGAPGYETKYRADLAPAIWRFLPGMERINRGGSPTNAAAGNLFDPLMLALMTLYTTGVQRETVNVSDKLQRARHRNGKLPIPPYDVVHAREYVTLLTNRARGLRPEAKGGTHASPIPHLRLGHKRTYPETGRVSIIHDTLVNVDAAAREAFKSKRTHYEVRL